MLAASSSQPDLWGPYTWFFPVSLISTDYSKLADNEVHVYYRRGYDWFTVTERPRAGGTGNSVAKELDPWDAQSERAVPYRDWITGVSVDDYTLEKSGGVWKVSASEHWMFYDPATGQLGTGP